MAAVIPFIPYIASAVGVVGQSNAADARLEEAKKAELNYAMASKQASAVGQFHASERIQEAALLASRAQAVSAASGGGALDPTVLHIVSGITAKGKYGAAMEVMNANDQANTLLNEGAAAGREGRAGYAASRYSIASTALSGFSNAWQSYH